MCDPLTLTAAALQAGSSIANGMAEREAANARSAALSAERTRQSGMEAQQRALADGSQQSMQDFGGQQQERAADLTQFFQQPVASDANAEAGMIAPEGSSSITVREMNKQSADATDRTNQRGTDLARMRSFGDLMGDRMRGVQRNSGAIDQLTGFRGGSTDALAFELDAAAQKGAGKRALGDLLGGAGAVLGGYAGMAGAGNPVVTRGMDRLGLGGDPLAAALRGAGQPAMNVRRGLLG